VILATLGLLLREELLVFMIGPVLLLGLSGRRGPTRLRVAAVAAFGVAALLCLVARRSVAHPLPFYWGGPFALIALTAAALFCALPGVGIVRVDVAVFTTLCMAVGVGFAATRLLALRWGRAVVCYAVALSVMIGVGGGQSRAYDLRDDSLGTLERNLEFIDGRYAQSTIPEARRRRVAERLRARGLSSQRPEVLRSLRRAATHDPHDPSRPFAARFNLLFSRDVAPRLWEVRGRRRRPPAHRKTSDVRWWLRHCQLVAIRCRTWHVPG